MEGENPKKTLLKIIGSQKKIQEEYTSKRVEGVSITRRAWILRYISNI